MTSPRSSRIRYDRAAMERELIDNGLRDYDPPREDRRTWSIPVSSRTSGQTSTTTVEMTNRDLHFFLLGISDQLARFHRQIDRMNETREREKAEFEERMALTRDLRLVRSSTTDRVALEAAMDRLDDAQARGVDLKALYQELRKGRP